MALGACLCCAPAEENDVSLLVPETAMPKPSFQDSSGRKRNVILGGPAQQHRVGITSWSLTAPRAQRDLDATVKAFHGDLAGLFGFLKGQGFDGVELTIPDLRSAGFLPDMGDDEAVEAVRGACASSGLQILGSLLHVTDGGSPLGPSALTGLDFDAPGFFDLLRQHLSREKKTGSEYATFQIDLRPEQKGTGGAYRCDEEYLKLCAERVHQMQKVCFELDMNFYVETHVDRISEDPEALCKIFDYCPSYFEVNADISHYLYRNIHRGPHLERILERVGHTHQRMARKHGDISANVGVHFDSLGEGSDPAEDWAQKGVTWQAMEAMAPVLKRGLSSRAVVAESGPCFEVRDALALDILLLPLFRSMAKAADGQPCAGNPFKSAQHTTGKPDVATAKGGAPCCLIL